MRHERVDIKPSIADGLLGTFTPLTFDISHNLLEDIVLVEETEIIEAMRVFQQDEQLMVEGSACVGLAAILHASALAFQVIKYLGVAYLFYMAWNILREGGALKVSEEDTETASWRIVLNGMLLNVLNPKLSLFFLAFLPQFIPVETINAAPVLALHALMFMALTFIVFVGYGACASMARDYVISRPSVLRWLRRSFAGGESIFGKPRPSL